jgi:hypothetical protein
MGTAREGGVEEYRLGPDHHTTVPGGTFAATALKAVRHQV